MSEASHNSISRRRLLEAAGTAAATAAAFGLNGRAEAAAPSTETMPFRANTSGIADFFIIPTDPPIGSGRLNFKGTSELLGGEITQLDHHIGHLTAEGVFKRSTDGVAVFTGANGNALYLNWSGVAKPSGTPGVYNFSGSFTVQGGKGEFAGATGSGDMNSVVDLNKLEVNQVWEGTITRLRC
jgi:hypothetical protein